MVNSLRQCLSTPSSLVIKPRFSPVLLFFFSMVYLIILGVTTVAQMPLYLHFICAAFVLIHATYVLMRYVFYRHSCSIQSLWYKAQGGWQIRYRNSVCLGELQLVQSVIVSRYLIFLAFKVPGRFFSVAVPLAVGSDTFENLHGLRCLLVSRKLKLQ